MTCFVKAGPEFRVDTRVNGTQADPAVAALALGGFVMTWTDNTYLLEELGGADVRAQIYGAAGERIGGEFLINTETIDHQRDAKIAGLQGGGFVVVWQDFSGTRGDECGSSNAFADSETAPRELPTACATASSILRVGANMMTEARAGFRAFNEGAKDTGWEVDFVALRRALAANAPWTDELTGSIQPREGKK